MQNPNLTKPTLQQQLEFITGALTHVEMGHVVELNHSNSVMLHEIAQNLAAVNFITAAKKRESGESDELSINWETLKDRLHLLFRILHGTTVELQREGMPTELMEAEISRIFTHGCVQIYTRRRYKLIEVSQAEANDARNMSSIVIEAFHAIHDRIFTECSGMPITIAITRGELIVMEGIDKLLENLKHAMKEVHHG